jgi:spore coat polysaccharide biosynthesis predicted glycosyltransferase SpsG
MPPVTIALIADGAPEAGLGHLARCSAIATALRARGDEIAAHAYGARAPLTVDGVRWVPAGELPSPRAIVLDTYTMPATERAALAATTPLAFFDDVGEVPPGAALVIRMRGGAAGVLSGLGYAPLRAAYWGLPERRVRERVERVLITTGGGALQDAGLELARVARSALPGVSVALVRGPHARFDAPPGVELVHAPPSLLGELLAADVVISAAGQTALEAAATGAATLALPLVGNQRPNAEALAAAGAALVVEPGELATVLPTLDFERRTALVRAGQRAVDGFGALRIAFRVAQLA